ncbi:MAG: FAD-binding oxidoreductase [Chloroflexi bacterium]|nr:FAD-binding oxidoreductase [Chloroflexota bacterium]
MTTNQNDTLHNHKWGFVDTAIVLQPDRTVTMTGNRYELSGTVMPEFIPFVEEMLGIKLDPRDTQQERTDKPIAEPIINEAFYQAVQQTFPATKYTLDPEERLLHSHGQTTADEVYPALYGQLERTVDMTFFCETEEDAIEIVKLAQTHNVCLVPYGGGTSVSSALKLPTQEQRMIVSVDMQRMNRIEWIDKENMRACVQAGITGRELEKQLAKDGFLCGHEPDSMELSTLGGWIATNASGMKKNRYGNIEDIVENVTLVTPKGVLNQLEAMPRLSIGMQPQKLLFGNEGNLGIITKAVIRIHRLPETKQYGSVVFPTFEAGVAFLYELTRAGITPASVRLVDNFQFRFGGALRPHATFTHAAMNRLQKLYLLRVKGFDPKQLAATTIVMEGSEEAVKQQAKQLYKLAEKHGGIAGGEGHGKRGYMLTYAIAYIRDFFLQYHVMGETYETTVPWSKIHAVCKAVLDEAEAQHKAYNLPGNCYVSYRVTQCYHTGVCIYFTHGFYAKGVDRPDKIFQQIEHKLRQVIMDAGGSISHHHGVGKIRKDFMDQTISPTSIELVKQTKQTLDPQDIFGIHNNIFAE